MKHRLTKQEKENLENRIVFASAAIFLYALLLAFIQKMAASSSTVSGALAFIEILWWASLAGAMLCAWWGAYKEKKSFFFYCAACLFIFLSTTVLRFCTGRSSRVPFLINYLALIAMFFLIQIFRFLKVKGWFENKKVKMAFFGVCALALVVLAVISIMNINRIFF